MAEKIKIVIDPPESHPDFLTIQDAMEQVLDYFRLASLDDLDDSQNVVWKLASISMQSPLTVVAEAISYDPTINIDAIAKLKKDSFKQGITSVLRGVTPIMWTGGEASKIIERVLKRNKNGIGKTSIVMDFQDDAQPIEITPTMADSAIIEIQKQPFLYFREEGTSHKELGAVDGYVVAVGSDYGQPAIQIEERLTGETIWCRVPEETINTVSMEMKLDDVWKHRRIIVHGLIHYEKTGKISRVYDAEIEPITTREVSIDEIRDPGFTKGLSPSEYLDKLREGNFG